MPRVVAAALVAVVLLLGAATGGARSADRAAPVLVALNVTNGSGPFAGDHRLLTTITPTGDGFRERAAIHFTLLEAANVRLTICRTTSVAEPVYARSYRLRAGRHTLYWEPGRRREARTYLARLLVRDRAGNTRRYGSGRAVAGSSGAPVIRLQGVDAAFTESSYRPGARARLRIATDAGALEIQLFRSGPEFAHTPAAWVMRGYPVSPRFEVDWPWRSRPHLIDFDLPDRVTGFYFAKLTAPDGRIGYAPFILRPATLGKQARVAVVLPTNTWQAYNFYDADGNGWGDTWYAGPEAGPAVLRIGLHRPYLNRGVPPFFRRYDVGFLHWLAWTGQEVEYLSDQDLGRFRTAGRLARAYDLVVFPGHEEYVTPSVYRIVRRYRNRGGNLIFLSANNFYWRVVAHRGGLRRTRKWRDLGLPEAGLIGVQYRANDRGKRQRPYVVRRAGRARWLFEDTGLRNGSGFGRFGIEIDGRAPASPRGTIVLADIRNLLGRGRTAQMTYYERHGAKVFAFGAFTLGGSATQPLHRALLENLWARLAVP